MHRLARLWLAAAALPLSIAQTATAEPVPSISGFAGIQIYNNYNEVLIEPWTTDFGDAALAGVAGALDWQLWRKVSYGIEGQIVGHFGSNSHFAVNFIPLNLRYTPDGEYGPIRSFAGGLGVSIASDDPSFEIERQGETQTVLAYWYLETAFDGMGPKRDLFLRLHHRSNAYGTFEADGSSNAVVLGVRQRF